MITVGGIGDGRARGHGAKASKKGAKQERKQGECNVGVVVVGGGWDGNTRAHARLEPRPVASDESLSRRGLSVEFRRVVTL